MSKIVSKGTPEDEFIVVTPEEYAFVHWTWLRPSASVHSARVLDHQATEYRVRCPEYAKLRQTRLMKLIR